MDLLLFLVIFFENLSLIISLLCAIVSAILLVTVNRGRRFIFPIWLLGMASSIVGVSGTLTFFSSIGAGVGQLWIALLPPVVFGVSFLILICLFPRKEALKVNGELRGVLILTLLYPVVHLAIELKNRQYVVIRVVDVKDSPVAGVESTTGFFDFNGELNIKSDLRTKLAVKITKAGFKPVRLSLGASNQNTQSLTIERNNPRSERAFSINLPVSRQQFMTVILQDLNDYESPDYGSKVFGPITSDSSDEPRQVTNVMLGDEQLRSPEVLTLLKQTGRLSEAEYRPGDSTVRLNLSYTRVNDSNLPNVISSIEHIHILDLSFTDITDDGLRHLLDLKELEALYVNGTSVSDSGVRTLRALPRLRSIEARKTAVTSDIQGVGGEKYPPLHIHYDDNAVDFFYSGITNEQMLSSVKAARGRITSLDFRGTKVSLEGIAALGVMPYVTELRLGGMKFPEGVLPLSNFPSLEVLDIPEAEYKPDFLSQLERVKNVKKINLSHTNVSDEIIRDLEELPNLKVVYLTGCKISDLALEPLAKKAQVSR